MTHEVQSSGIQKAPPKILPFEVHDGFAIAHKTPKEIPSLVEGLLLEVGTSMVSAKPKTGKSSMLRTLAVAIAEGRPFFGQKVKQGNVLYLNLEGPQGVIGQHINQLGLTGRNGKVHIVDERMPLKGEIGLARLCVTIEKYMPVKLVILDPAAKILRLMDSYDPGQVGLAIEELETIAKKYSLHLMFSSHSKKKQTDDVGDGPMGSTSFRGGTDSNLFIVRDSQKNRIISTEQRWGVEMEPRLLIQDEYGKSVLGSTVEDLKESRTESKRTATTKRIRQSILDFLCRPETVQPTKRELLAAIDGKTVQVSDVIADMVADKTITETPDGKALRYAYVGLPVEQLVEDQAEEAAI